MIINATQIREGMILLHEGELWRVTWTMHRTPGKGNACMQTKLKNIINGKNLECRFLSAERVEKAELQTREMQFLYSDPTGYIFMDMQDYDQVTLPEELIGRLSQFLKPETSYPVQFYNGQAVGIEVPSKLAFRVTSAPPEIKKATASASLRPVTLENGMTVNAPAFIQDGDIILINTETEEYLERVKS